MLPSKVDITMSMLEREALNLANFIAGRFGHQNHPAIKLALNYGKQMYGDKIRATIASFIDSDESIEVGTETLKEVASDYLDSFQARLKAKLAQKEANNAHTLDGTQAPD